MIASATSIDNCPNHQERGEMEGNNGDHGHAPHRCRLRIAFTKCTRRMSEERYDHDLLESPPRNQKISRQASSRVCVSWIKRIEKRREKTIVGARWKALR